MSQASRDQCNTKIFISLISSLITQGGHCSCFPFDTANLVNGHPYPCKADNHLYQSFSWLGRNLKLSEPFNGHSKLKDGSDKLENYSL